MRSRRITAMALSTLVASGGLAAVQDGTARATEAGGDGLLATSVPGGVFISGADTAGQNPAPTFSAMMGAVAWSSDGARLAWAGPSGIWLSDPNGANQVHLANTAGSGNNPTWYASNSEVVYEKGITTASGGSEPQLYAAPVAGTAAATPLLGVANTGFCDTSPKAHGTLVAFVRSSAPQCAVGSTTPRQIWIYDSSTGAAHEVVSDGFDPDISPDGTKLVFSRSLGVAGEDDLYEANLDGSGVSQLTATGAAGQANVSPVWSPSGTRIAVQTGQNTDILVPSTQALTLWAAGTTGHPAWQPVVSTTRAVLKPTVGTVDPATGLASVTLDASGTTVPGVTSYTFDFGDGAGPQVSATPTITRPEKVGSYTASVSVTDAQSHDYTATAQVVVALPAFSPVLAASVGATVSDTGHPLVTLDATGSAGAGATYSFDFGDGKAAQSSSTPVVSRPEPEGTYKVVVQVTDVYGRTAASAPQWLTVGDGYHPVTPTRLLDTRSGLGAPKGAARSVTLSLPASVLGNPGGPVTAVVLNVTVTDTHSAGFVEVYPYGQAAPNSSNLNFTAGQTVANLVTVPVVDDKVVILANSGTAVSLIADISGYYTAGSSGAGFAPVTPVRLMDTRDGTGGVGRRVAGYGKVSLPVPATVPQDATAVVLNVTAVDTAAAGDLDVYPDVPGQAPPVVSNLNFGPGAIVPNLVIVPVSADRKIDFYLHSPGSADMLADIEGYFSPTATSRFVPESPIRLVDTRNGDAGGTVKSGHQINLLIGERFQVPNSALTAGLYNTTVTQPAGAGHVTVYPDGLATVPTVSNLNYTTGQTVPNAVLAPMTDGVEDFYNAGASTQLIVDFFGYFAKPLASDPPTPGHSVF
jgi:hypothetical protein